VQLQVQIYATIQLDQCGREQVQGLSSDGNWQGAGAWARSVAAAKDRIAREGSVTGSRGSNHRARGMEGDGGWGEMAGEGAASRGWHATERGQLGDRMERSDG
jgi:hypothetical protein